jgi:hypothetical protein
MSDPVQKPKFIGHLMPIKEPVVSPFEIRGREIIVSTGATLPPLCLITGEALELKKEYYKLEYLRVEGANFKPESLLIRGHDAEPFSAKAIVRYALCDRAMRRSVIMEKALPALLILGVIGCFVIFSYLRDNALLLPGYKAAIMGSCFGGFLFLWRLLRKSAVVLTATQFNGARIAISGIDKKVLNRMLQWQQESSAPTSS